MLRACARLHLCGTTGRTVLSVWVCGCGPSPTSAPTPLPRLAPVFAATSPTRWWGARGGRACHPPQRVVPRRNLDKRAAAHQEAAIREGRHRTYHRVKRARQVWRHRVRAQTQHHLPPLWRTPGDAPPPPPPLPTPAPPCAAAGKSRFVGPPLRGTVRCGAALSRRAASGRGAQQAGRGKGRAQVTRTDLHRGEQWRRLNAAADHQACQCRCRGVRRHGDGACGWPHHLTLPLLVGGGGREHRWGHRCTVWHNVRRRPKQPPRTALHLWCNCSAQQVPHLCRCLYVQPPPTRRRRHRRSRAPQRGGARARRRRRWARSLVRA